MRWLLDLYPFVELIGILAALGAIWRARTAQGATGWAVALILMPLLSIPLFVVFGNHRFVGYVTRRKNKDKRLNQSFRHLKTYFDEHRCFAQRESDLTSVFEKLTLLPFVSANSARLLINGKETYQVLEESLRGAQRSISFQFYIMRSDKIGQQFQEVLIQKAREGVKVRVLYDGAGSQLPHQAIKKMKAAGIEVFPFISTRFKLWRTRLQLNFRNHRKLVIIDDQKVFVGGINIGDEYLSENSEFGFWRDTQVLLEGPIALQGVQSFLADWYWASGQTTDWEAPISLPPNSSSVSALLMATGPVGDLESASLAVLQAIQEAQKRIWLATPYFIPDEQIISALQLAVLRGVEVKLLVPKKSDNWIARLASFPFIWEIIGNGVQVFQYEKGFMHQKVILVDDHVCYVGSMNLDNRSFRLNFEIGAWIIQKSFAGEVAQMLETDIQDSIQLKRRELSKRPLLWLLAYRIARLFSPIL
jgi:cardiolipin synthase